MQAVPKLHEALVDDLAWAIENEVCGTRGPAVLGTIAHDCGCLWIVRKRTRRCRKVTCTSEIIDVLSMSRCLCHTFEDLVGGFAVPGT